MDRLSLTPRQRKILAFVERRIREGAPPTYREIAASFGISSVNGVKCHLKALEDKGFIRFVPDQARNIRLTKRATCPHCGGKL